MANTQAAARGNKTFNSLYEIHPHIEGVTFTAKITFNSLYEIHSLRHGVNDG